MQELDNTTITKLFSIFDIPVGDVTTALNGGKVYAKPADASPLFSIWRENNLIVNARLLIPTYNQIDIPPENGVWITPLNFYSDVDPVELINILDAAGYKAPINQSVRVRFMLYHLANQ